MPDLMEDFFNVDFYDKAIDRCCDKSMPRSTIRKFCTPEYRIKLLNSLADGTFTFSPPRVVQIPKDNGKIREIYVNNCKDRLIFTAINDIWNQRYADKISPACKAYLAGSSCAKTVKEAAKHTAYGYKVDLSKYFDSVPIGIINSILAEVSTQTPLDEAVFAYYNTDIAIVNGQKVPRYKSLAQGCALSAFLSNCALRDIDDAMSQMCDYYCRYSDDMLLLGNNADKALAVLKDMLSEKKLALNPDKIEQVSPDQEFRFLGFGIKGNSITISQRDFNSKKAEIKHITRVIQHSKLPYDAKLKKVVSQIFHLFINWSEPTYSWIYTKAQAVNDISRLAELDRYCKEHIRAAVTGKWNYTTNMHRVPDEKLRNAGYVSLVQMFNLAKMDRTLFLQECLQWKQHLS